jgi:uncharacterized protein YkwD
LAHEALESRVLFASVAPTNEEQLMIELVNRARANPPQYAQDFFLSVPLTDAQPMPPLAVNGFLTASARGHALEMAGNDYFAHTSPISGKGPNQMARDAGYPLGAQFSTALTANNVESIAAGPGMSGPRPALEMLLEDIDPATQQPRNPPGHRQHLLGMLPFFAAHDEIGVGHAFEVDSEYEHYWSIQTAFDDAPGKFLTGVAFDDRNFPDEFYSLNEGLGGVTVTARNDTSGQTFSTTTWASGGYSLRLQPGTYTVTGSGGGLPTPVVYQNVVISTQNVKRDFMPGADATPPTATLLANTLRDANAQPFDFTVSYADAGGINGVTLDSFDLRVLGPNGYNQAATFLEASGGGNSMADPLVGEYTIPAPGGSWDFTDNGTYTVHVQTNQVRDRFFNAVPPGPIGILTVNVTLPGDANRDGRVNGADFSILAGNFGKAGRTWETADFTGDGLTNGGDFSLLAGNFGKTVPGLSLTAGVTPAPQPAAPATPAAPAIESTDGGATGAGPAAPVQAMVVAPRARTVQPPAPKPAPAPAPAATPRRVIPAAPKVLKARRPGVAPEL